MVFNLTNFYTGIPKKTARDIWEYHLRFPNGGLAWNHAAITSIRTISADEKDFVSIVYGIQMKIVIVLFC